MFTYWYLNYYLVVELWYFYGCSLIMFYDYKLSHNYVCTNIISMTLHSVMTEMSTK